MFWACVRDYVAALAEVAVKPLSKITRRRACCRLDLRVPGGGTFDIDLLCCRRALGALKKTAARASHFSAARSDNQFRTSAFISGAWMLWSRSSAGPNCSVRQPQTLWRRVSLKGIRILGAILGFSIAFICLAGTPASAQKSFNNGKLGPEMQQPVDAGKPKGKQKLRDLKCDDPACVELYKQLIEALESFYIQQYDQAQRRCRQREGQRSA